MNEIEYINSGYKASKRLKNETLWYLRAPSEVGLVNQDFRDLEHLNTGDSLKWTTFFVKWLKTSRNIELLTSDSKNLEL